MDDDLKHFEDQLDRIEEKIDDLRITIHGNNSAGLKTVVALNSQFVNKACEIDLLTKVTQNTEFRTSVKKLAFKVLLAAITSGGVTAGLVQGLSKLFGG